MNEREMLHYRMRELASEDICLVFSGGVDSSLLLKLAADAAVEIGKRVYAATFDSRLHPSRDLKIARRVAGELGGIHQVIKADELEQEEMRFDPENRCYPCKCHLFITLKDLAQEKGVRRILDGTSEDDMHVYRPGIHALRELGIINPLAELHITKETVKEMAVEYNTPAALRLSIPCMATRLPYNTKIDYEMLERITHGEEYLKSVLGDNVRLRFHGQIARLEVDQSVFPSPLEMREEMVRRLKMLGFTYVTLDMEGFRPESMDVGIKENR